MIRPQAVLRSLVAPLILGLFQGPAAAAGDEFDLTPAQRARLEKFLPRTLHKLEKKEPVHALIVGDSVMSMFVHTDDQSDTLKSYPGVFLGLLADQFYYTGGLRVLRPVRGKPEKSLRAFGPEVTTRNASRGGRLMIHAMNVLEAAAWDENPDLILVNFGINDADANHSLATYRRAAQDAVSAARAHQADILLLGATPTLADPPEHGLALTRAYVDTLREVAETHGVFFADLGDIGWMVRVDEPMKDLEKPAPRQARGGDAAPPPQPAAPGAITDFPKSEDLDPDPEKRAARLFHQVTTGLRRWFDHGATVDLIHPNPSMHRLLGRRLFNELLDGPRPVPWALRAGTADFKDAALCEVTFRVENTLDAPLRVNLLPLVTSHWKPKDAVSQLELKPGRKGVAKITYLRVGASNDATPPHEPLLRLPIMVIGAGTTRIEDLRATIRPFTMLWNLSTQFNQEGGVTLAGRIVNTTDEPLNGTWQAAWLEQKFNGTFAAPPRGESPVTFHLKLPEGAAVRQRGTLNFTATAGHLPLSFPRTVELVQNIGLKQVIPLSIKGTPDGEAARQPDAPGVTFRVDADPDALYLTWDVQRLNLADPPAGGALGGALAVSLNLDARSYGKRLAPGVTDALRITAGSADGPATILAFPPWAFGNGYNGSYDRTSCQAALSSRPDGSRRLTVMLPRNLFNLHEWALGNGNSQLGFATVVSVWQPPDEKHPQGSDLVFDHPDNGLHRDEAESLGVVELSPQPTSRWTVHFY